MKTIGFLVQGELGISLAVWAIKEKKYDKHIVFCRRDVRDAFKSLENVALVDSEEDIYKHEPNVIFSLGYWKIIKKQYVDKFRIINLHHSYNLTYRGRHMCSWAILNARKHNLWVHGTTFHEMGEKLDSGNIIYSEQVPIYEGDTSYSLFLRCDKIAERIWKDNYKAMIQGKYETYEVPIGQFHYKERDLKHRVDLNMLDVDICDSVRALTFPDKRKPYAIVNGHVIELILKDGVAT